MKVVTIPLPSHATACREKWQNLHARVYHPHFNITLKPGHLRPALQSFTFHVCINENAGTHTSNFQNALFVQHTIEEINGSIHG